MPYISPPIHSLYCHNSYLQTSGSKNFCRSYLLSTVSYPVSKSFRGISKGMSCQNIRNWNEISTLNLVNLPHFSASTNGTHLSSCYKPWASYLWTSFLSASGTRWGRCFILNVSHTSNLHFLRPRHHRCGWIVTTASEPHTSAGLLPLVKPASMCLHTLPPLDIYLLQNFQQHVLPTLHCLAVTFSTSDSPSWTDFLLARNFCSHLPGFGQLITLISILFHFLQAKPIKSFKAHLFQGVFPNYPRIHSSFLSSSPPNNHSI